MLATPRLILRPFTPADAPKLFAMSREAGIVRFIPDQVYRDEAHALAVADALSAFTAQPPDPAVRPYVLGVELRETRALIGHVGLSPARGSVEIGYAIEDSQQGRGFGAEAVAAAAAWALELGCSEVLGVVARDNAPSRRVLEKAGFAIAADEGARIVYRRV